MDIKLKNKYLYTIFFIVGIYIFSVSVRNRLIREVVIGGVVLAVLIIFKQYKGCLIIRLSNFVMQTIEKKSVKFRIIAGILSIIILGMFLTILFFASMQHSNLIGAGLVVFVGFGYAFLILRYIFKKVDYLNVILKATEEMSLGNLDYIIEERGQGTLSKIAYNINNIKDGYKKSLEEKVKSERLKSELITNVSHDLKTPLTSIINYVNLLKKENLSKGDIGAYISILDRKSVRLKTLIEDLFEASKMSSGAVKLNIEKLDVVALLKQAIAEFDEKMKKSSLKLKAKYDNSKIYANLDGKKTWRVFENLINNMIKYSQPNTRIYIDLIEENNKVIIIMKNISCYEMDFSAEEIFERFKRGDKSRKTEGSGLGLAIAKSIVELQGGTLNIEIDGDLFKSIIEFNISMN